MIRFRMEIVLKILVLVHSVLCVDLSRYEQLNIEISEDVRTTDCNRTLQNLEDLILETSKRIFNITSGKVQLRNVVIKLPGSWEADNCAPPTLRHDADDVASPDFLVQESHPLLGDRLPWTVQHEGCGQPGRQTELPIGFLANHAAAAEEEEDRATLLMKEWLKLKFGVFEEDGFQGDPLYPSLVKEGKENITNSGCLHKVQGVCPREDYKEDLPTKQNVLCSRRSVLSVLDDTLADVTSNTTSNVTSRMISVLGSPAFLPVNFRYVVPRQHSRILIVLDRTSSMGMNNRWSLLHRELFRLISSLPDNTEVGIITFGQRPSVSLMPTVLSAENREGVYGRIPRRHLDEEEACLDCAMRLASETMRTGGNRGSIILITASATRPTEFEQMVARIRLDRIPVYTVTFEKSLFYETRLLGEFGSTYVVHEKQHDILAGTINLSDIFTRILNSVSSGAAGPSLQKFHEEQRISDDSSMVTGSLVVEESLRDNVWVQITSPDRDDIEMFELTSPTGKLFQFPNYEHGLVYFRLTGRQEPGIWTYRARLFKKEQHVRVSVIAMAEPSHRDSFNLETWTSVNHEGVNALNTPVKLFARLTSHVSQVINAEVVATIHRPGDSEPVSVVLRDSGTGYPDITRGDGVYSAYFTQFTSEPGFYSVVVSVRNKDGGALLPRLSSEPTVNNSTSSCCGSSLPFTYTVPLPQFTRFTLSGSFFVKEGSQFYLRQGSPTRNDVFPPSRITDFQLANYLDNSLYVTLKWTAPGNDYDFGQAFRYEIRCYTNREALREENFTDMGILVHTSLIPIPETYGTEQRSTVGIPWPNEVFYYAIVAYDEEGNRGEVSNVVSVFAEETPATLPPTPEADETGREDDLYPVHESLPLTAPDNDTLIYVVSGIVSAILVVILVILLTALFRSKWSSPVKANNAGKIYVKDGDTSSLGGTLKRIVSMPDIDKEQKVWKDSDSCEKTSIPKSPVPSISDNLSWRYVSRAVGQEMVGVHREYSHHQNHHNSSSTDSSMYSSNDSETTASAEFVLGGGPEPRISVMEDYTVYRDLSHLDSMNQDYFSFSQLPQELQGVSIVPYSPGYDIVESSKRRHVSLV